MLKEKKRNQEEEVDVRPNIHTHISHLSCCECVRKRYEEELSLSLRRSCRWDFFHLEFWLSLSLALTVIVERATALDVGLFFQLKKSLFFKDKKKCCPDWVNRMQSGRKAIIACVSSNLGWNYLHRYESGRLNAERLSQSRSAQTLNGFIVRILLVRNLVPLRTQLTWNNCKSVCQKLFSKVPETKNTQPRRCHHERRARFFFFIQNFQPVLELKFIFYRLIVILNITI